MISSWFLFAFAGSLCSALALYSHQRLKGKSAASAVWVKLIAVAISAPVLACAGLPHQPMFYVFTALAAMIWCINDLIYYRGVSNHGAALLSRLTPLGIIVSFAAWFAVKPELLDKYLHDWPRFAAVCATLLFAAFCAFEAKKCPYSAKALKSIWFVIVAAVIGSFLVKSALDTASVAQGIFGYVGIEAALMLVFYAFYFSCADRATGRVIFSRDGAKTGIVVGGFMTACVILRVTALQKVDHPAYVSMISMLDVAWLMLFARLSGWKDNSNKWAGLGIVLAAVLLAILKIR